MVVGPTEKLPEIAKVPIGAAETDSDNIVKTATTSRRTTAVLIFSSLLLCPV